MQGCLMGLMGLRSNGVRENDVGQDAGNAVDET